MPNQSGPTTSAGKAASSRNAMRHGLTNLHPVVTEDDRPEYEALREHLLDSLQPVGFLQGLTVQRLVNAAWNMQRCLKLENQVMASIDGADPLGDPDTQKQVALFQRYYLRFEGSYRASLRELERLQRLQLLQDVHFGEEHAVSALHDLQLYQRFAKQNGLPPQPVQEPAQNPQPLSNQQGAKRNAAPFPKVGRNSPCPCGSTKKYKRCCGVNAPPILHAA
ncbi:MAG: SEC-C domain-containing protein [Bryobacterales bacterium]|nr:SEC-C domain-containing protein [Bryobacterales bacterium]